MATTFLNASFQSEVLMHSVPPFIKVPKISHAAKTVDSEFILMVVE